MFKNSEAQSCDKMPVSSVFLTTQSQVWVHILSLPCLTMQDHFEICFKKLILSFEILMSLSFSIELQPCFVFFRDGDIASKPGLYDLVIVTSCKIKFPDSTQYTQLNLDSDKQWNFLCITTSQMLLKHYVLFLWKLNLTGCSVCFLNLTSLLSAFLAPTARLITWSSLTGPAS